MKAFYHLLGVSMLSINIPGDLPIYPLLFLLSSGCAVLYCVRRRCGLVAETGGIVLASTLFILNAVIIHLACFEESSAYQLSKLVVNLVFLSSSCCLLFALRRDSVRMVSILAQYLLVAIVLSALQVLLLVYSNSLWLMPVSGVTSSIDAYNLFAKSTIYFGTDNKNIFSTRILFFYLSLVLFFRVNGISKNAFIVATVATVFCIIYLQSRTGLLALCAFGAVLVGNKLRIVIVRGGALSAILITVLIPLAIATGYLTLVSIEYFLRGTSINELSYVSAGADGDGLKARLIMWIVLFQNLDQFNMVFGNGLFHWSYTGLTREGNLHNVFLNTWIDLGLVGLAVYISLLWKVFCVVRPMLLAILAALFIVVNSHYLGYDNDIVILLLMYFVYSRITSINNKKLCVLHD